MAIAVDDCNRHDGDKTVERVERRKLKLVLIESGNEADTLIR